jgi:prepilin-type N-terminal cleavage/methylation domain-containing protein
MQRRKAFTLTELLVVISIIVVVIAVLVPSIKTLTGDRSVPLARNRLAALLATARESAINSNSIVGIAVFPDVLGSHDTIVAFVQTNPYASGASVSQYLDIIPGSEMSVLQPGVTAEVIMGVAPPASSSPAAFVQRYAPIGVILFDPQGHLLANQNYPVLMYQPGLPTQIPTLLGQEFQLNPIPPAGGGMYAPSGIGLAVADSETYKNAMTLEGATDLGLPGAYCVANGVYGSTSPPANFKIGGLASASATPNAGLTPANTLQWGVAPSGTNFGVQGMSSPTNTPPTATDMNTESTKENWLDQNADILMLNPSTGSLIIAK